MLLIKQSLTERILKAARHNHGLRLNHKDAKELLAMYTAKNMTHSARFTRAVNKLQGLRIHPQTVKEIKLDLGLGVTNGAAAATAEAL